MTPGCAVPGSSTRWAAPAARARRPRAGSSWSARPSPPRPISVDLNPDAEALAVTSSLTTEAALHAFAALEQAMREDEDALFRSADTAVSDFISFVWLMLAIEEDKGTDPAAVDLPAIVDSTLAAQSPQARAACLTIAQPESAAPTCKPAPRPAAAGREPRPPSAPPASSTSSPTASPTPSSASTSKERSATSGTPCTPSTGSAPPSRSCSACPKPPHGGSGSARKEPRSRSTQSSLLTGWLTGTSLPDLAEAHLAAAADPAWRIEQMVDAVTEHFEHYLAWTVGALVELVNTRLADAGIEERLCPDLGSYIRYGVR